MWGGACARDLSSRHWLFEQQQKKNICITTTTIIMIKFNIIIVFGVHLKSSSTPPSSTSNYRLCVVRTCICTFGVRHVCLCLLLTSRCHHHFISLFLPERVLFKNHAPFGFLSSESVHRISTRTVEWWKCCFTSTETVGLLGTGAQDVHPDFHTATEF